MSNRRWKHRPENATWGDFGPDDQIGRLNLLTPQKIREGIAEVREARAFCLSLPLDFPGDNTLNPRRYPPKLRPTYRAGLPNMNYLMQRGDPQLTDVLNDDAVLLHLQYSTQWDSLAHVGQLFDADGDGIQEQVYYNGFRAHEHVVGPVRYEGQEVEPTHAEQTGAYRLGIETMAETCVQGRGVMIDLEAHLGRDFTRVGYETTDAHPGRRQGRGDGGRPRMPAHRLRPGVAGHEQAPDRGGAGSLRRPRRPRPETAATGSPIPASPR